jgi:hypothetical protein
MIRLDHPQGASVVITLQDDGTLVVQENSAAGHTKEARHPPEVVGQDPEQFSAGIVSGYVRQGYSTVLNQLVPTWVIRARVLLADKERAERVFSTAGMPFSFTRGLQIGSAEPSRFVMRAVNSGNEVVFTAEVPDRTMDNVHRHVAIARALDRNVEVIMPNNSQLNDATILELPFDETSREVLYMFGVLRRPIRFNERFGSGATAFRMN